MRVFFNWRLFVLITTSSVTGVSCSDPARDQAATAANSTPGTQVAAATPLAATTQAGLPPACESAQELREHIAVRPPLDDNPAYQLMEDILAHAELECSVALGISPPPSRTPRKTPPLPNAAVRSPSCTEATKTAIEGTLAEIGRLQQQFTDRHPSIVALNERLERLQERCLAAAGNNSSSGGWQLQDDELVCKGYVVRELDRAICTDELPEGWVPRTFKGQEYYFQPLGGTDRVLAGSN